MKNIENKYEIARQVEIEDMCNAMECIGVDINSIDDCELFYESCNSSINYYNEHFIEKEN